MIGHIVNFECLLYQQHLRLTLFTPLIQFIFLTSAEILLSRKKSINSVLFVRLLSGDKEIFPMLTEKKKKSGVSKHKLSPASVGFGSYKVTD